MDGIKDRVKSNPLRFKIHHSVCIERTASFDSRIRNTSSFLFHFIPNPIGEVKTEPVYVYMTLP